ncbi:MAG: toxin-antitoxin system HicB family antitoxin [Deltaproteobacteria bacterium]|nr:toxin-antitoxin system HicB family antitoxin [Deltaproteobacteria bacterium]
MTYAKTADRAVKKAPAAIASWIAAAKKLGHPIPAPLFTRPVSGKFNVRLPKELHRALVSRAIQEGVSLNQLVTTLLAHAV